MAEHSQQPRDADDGSTSLQNGEFEPDYEHSWAVLIGINSYKHHRKLEFATADAVAMARALIERLRFPRGNVFLVVNDLASLPPDLARWLADNRGLLAKVWEEGSKSIIGKLLITTLPELVRAKNDRVLIYFAGHGRNRSKGGAGRPKPFLIPEEAAHGEWDEYIDLDALAEHISEYNAKHVLCILDACCAGLLGVRADDRPRRYEQGLLQRKARQCITSGTAEERADDGGYQGHSLFTGYLLQALEQIDKDFLCASQLGTDLKHLVGAHSSSRQTPSQFTFAGDASGDFVFRAREAPLNFDELADLADLLVKQVGRRLDEPFPIELAGTLWRRIARAGQVGADASTPPPQHVRARREWARTALLCRDTALALDQLRDGYLRDDADAMLLRGMAQLRTGSMDGAADEFAALAARREHPYAAWAAHAEDLVRQPRGDRRALLIGVDEIGSLPKIKRIQGVAPDLKALQAVLTTKLGFREDSVTILVGPAATRAAIDAELIKLLESSHPEDSVVCYLAGLGFVRDGTAVYATYDLANYDKPGVDPSWITETWINKVMRNLPAQDKLLITDCCHLAPDGSDELAFRFLFACRRDEQAFDVPSDGDSSRGAFSYALENALIALGNAPMQQIVARITAEIAARGLPQTPGYVGSRSSSFIGRRPAWLELPELAEQSHRLFTGEDIARMVRELDGSHGRGDGMAPIWLAIGRAQLALQDDDAAVDAFLRTQHPGGWLPLVRTELRLDRFGDAFDHWSKWHAHRERGGSEQEARIAEAHALLARFHGGVRHVLLIGCEPYTEHDIEQLLEDLRDQLIEHWTVADGIAICRNPGRAELLAAFEQLVRNAGDDPSFVVFIGPGFEDHEIWLASTGDLLYADLSLADLRDRAATCSNLTSAIFLTTTCRPEALTRPVPSAAPTEPQPGLGRSTLVAAPQPHRDIVSTESSPDVGKIFAVFSGPRGRPLTMASWLADLEPSSGLSIRGDRHAALLSYNHERPRAVELLRRIEQAPLDDVLALLKRMVDDADLATEARLLLAITTAQLQQFEPALAYVTAALDGHRAEPPASPTGSGPAARDPLLAELRYWKGRILLGLRRYAEAEYDFNRALDAHPEHARAHYYRARAIRQLIEGDLEAQLEVSVQRYIELGAPLGRVSEPRLRTRRGNVQ